MVIFHCYSCNPTDPCILSMIEDANLPTICPYAHLGNPPMWTRWLDEQQPEIQTRTDHGTCDMAIVDDERDKVHTPIICLCGSTRFTHDMLIKQWELTKQGHIVVSWCALPDDYLSYQGKEKAHIGDIENVKAFVDEIHKRKIDISDEVLVIDIDGYVGESTRSEINYATEHGKPVRYLSEELRQQAGDRK